MSDADDLAPLLPGNGSPRAGGPGRPGVGSLRRRGARAGATTLIAQLLKMAVSVASVIILARLISPDVVGLFAMAAAISGVAGIFLNFGLSVSALRSKELTHQQQSNLFWLNAGSGVALAAIVFACSWPIAAFYGQPELVPVTQWLSLTYLLGGLTAQFRVASNRDLRALGLAIGDVMAPIGGLAAAIVVAVLAHPLLALVVQQLTTSAITLVASVIAARWWPGLPRRTPGMRGLLTFGLTFAATQLLGYVTRNVDTVLIGWRWGAVELGNYDRAYRLSVGPILQMNIPMSRIALPVLARVADDPPRYAAAFREAQLIACYVTSSALLLLGGLAIPLSALLLGPDWAAAGQLLGVLAVSAMFRTIQQIAIWIFVSSGHAGGLFRSSLVGQLIIIVCLVVGLPWGAMGVAIGSVIGYALYWVISLLWAGRTTGVDVAPLFANSGRAVGLVGLPAGLLALASSLLLPLADIWRVLIGLGAALAWFGLITLLSRGVRRDIRRLFHFAKLAVGRG